MNEFQNEQEEIAALKKSLKWALEYINEENPITKIPNHECRYHHDLGSGLCGFCEEFVNAWELIDSDFSAAP